MPHVEAPPAILEQMVTMRIHLDDVTEENGPLRVQPGSHRLSIENIVGAGQCILANRGDVLLMRPLLLHSAAMPILARAAIAASPILNSPRRRVFPMATNGTIFFRASGKRTQ